MARDFAWTSFVKGDQSPLLGSSYTGTQIVGYCFKRMNYGVRSWKDLLLKLSSILHKMHGDEFHKVLGIKGAKRPYFTRNQEELRRPAKIHDTEPQIFAETALTADEIARRCYDLLAVFGISHNDLKIILLR